MAVHLAPKDYLIHTRTYMLARETPLLKGEKPLCKFLEELDKAEEKYLAQDDQKVDCKIFLWVFYSRNGGGGYGRCFSKV